MPKDVHKDFIGDMIFAVEGEEGQFFQYLRRTDPNSFGVYCSCGTYYVGWVKTKLMKHSKCPECNTLFESSMRNETPALITAHELIGGNVGIAQ